MHFVTNDEHKPHFFCSKILIAYHCSNSFYHVTIIEFRVFGRDMHIPPRIRRQVLHGRIFGQRHPNPHAVGRGPELPLRLRPQKQRALPRHRRVARPRPRQDLHHRASCPEAQAPLLLLPSHHLQLNRILDLRRHFLLRRQSPLHAIDHPPQPCLLVLHLKDDRDHHRRSPPGRLQFHGDDHRLGKPDLETAGGFADRAELGVSEAYGSSVSARAFPREGFVGHVLRRRRRWRVGYVPEDEPVFGRRSCVGSIAGKHSDSPDTYARVLGFHRKQPRRRHSAGQRSASGL